MTLVEAADRLIPREEPFASQDVADGLHERGVDVRVGVDGRRRARVRGEVEVELSVGGPVRADELLVAMGREPVTDEIGLETVGLEPGEPIEVDDSMRANDWLYAIGDVNGRVLLTHMGKYQARVAADVILGGEARRRPRTASAPPRVVFTDPQVAAVGYTAEAAARGGAERERGGRATQGNAGASFYGRRGRGHGAARDRRGPRGHRRRHLHRPRDRGVPARGDDRGRRRGARWTA